MKKKQLFFIILGFCAGVFFALFDTAIKNIDVAPIDSDFDFIFNELKNNFDFFKTFLYGIIGSIIPLTIFLFFNLLKRKIIN